MNKINLVYMVTLSALLFSFTATAKTPLNPLNVRDPNLKKLLESIPYISLEEICQDRVLSDFNIWYEAWIIKSLLNDKDTDAHKMDNILHSGIKDHVDSLKEQIKNMEKVIPSISNFPALHLEIKINDLNKKINELIEKPFTNDLDDPTFINKIKDHGHYAIDLLDAAVKTPLSNPMINAIGKSYKTDCDDLPIQKDTLIDKTVEELKTPLIQTLKRIIHLFASNKPGVYESLQNKKETIPLLQEFYDDFKFLLTPIERKEEILKNLIGKNNKKGSHEGQFFTEKFFDELLKENTAFNPLISRDKFITILNDEPNLEKIHEAAKILFFSWPFLNIFDAEEKDLALNVPRATRDLDPQDVKDKRKQARLRLMLYKVYLIARKEGVIPSDKDMDDIPILEKLKDWVQNTKDFDEPKFNEQNVLENPTITGNTQLIEPEKFRRYFLPLVNLICEKIPGCVLLSEQNKPKIIEKFLEFKNYKELEHKPDVAALIPQDIINSIKDQIIQDEIKQIQDEVEEILEEFDEDDLKRKADTPVNVILPNFSEIDEPLDNKIKTEKRIVKRKPSVNNYVEESFDEIDLDDAPLNIVNPVDKKSDLKEEELEKLAPRKKRSVDGRVPIKQIEKLNKLIDKFEDKNGALTDKVNDLVRTYIKEIEQTENDDKKRIAQKLLVETVRIRYKKEEARNKNLPKGTPKKNTALQIIQTANEFLAKTLRSSYDVSKTDGLKNFFMRIINHDLDLSFTTTSLTEQAFYNYDVIFFVYYANEDNYKLKVEGPESDKLSEDEKLLAEKKRDDTRNILETNFFAKKDELMTTVTKQAIRDKSLLRNSFLTDKSEYFEFFTKFIDFFEHYENIPKESKGAHGNYHSVFLNFYSFLVTLRSNMDKKVEYPYEYVLNKLEKCLIFTEKIENTKSVLNSYCTMSHRKYAEMYYFYKVYLIRNKKVQNIDLKPYQSSSYDTHIRLLLNFMIDYPEYRTAFKTGCNAVEKTPICLAEELFVKLLAYVHSPKAISDDLRKILAESSKGNDVNFKLEVLGAFEAVYLNIHNSNIKDYEKILDLKSKLLTMNIDLLNFGENDVEALTNYLMRTYRKLVFNKHEAPVAQAIQQILSGPQNTKEWIKDSFGNYMVHAGVAHLDYIKLFLQMSATHKEYKRLAEFIISTHSGFSLIKINSVEYDKDLANMIENAFIFYEQTQSVSAIPGYIKSWISQQYEKKHKICKNDIKTIITSTYEDEEDYDPMMALVEEREEEINASVVEENNQFDKLNSQSSSIKFKQLNIVVQEDLIEEFNEEDVIGDVDENFKLVRVIHEIEDSQGNVIETNTKPAYMMKNGERIEYKDFVDQNQKLNAELTQILEGKTVEGKNVKTTHRLITANQESNDELKKLVGSITGEDFIKQIKLHTSQSKIVEEFVSENSSSRKSIDKSQSRSQSRSKSPERKNTPSNQSNKKSNKKLI